MNRGNHQEEYLSPNQKAIKRLLKNKPAVVGLFIITIAIVIAILGYLISPDATPNANDQLPTVALKEPGFNVNILAVRKNRSFESQSFLTTMLFGKENPYTFIPINKSTIKGDSIIVDKYTADPNAAKNTIAYHLVNVAYPISINKKQIERNGDQFQFYDINDKQTTISVKDLLKTIESESLFEKTYYLGTDKFGRSMLSRLILGVRISLLVGLIAVFISLTIGILLGAIAGFFGGKVDDLIMLLINTVWSIPTLLLVFAIVLALGRGIGIIFLAVGLTMWVEVARIVRGQVLALKEIQFVEAAKSMGFGTARIIVRHILPNILGPVMVIAAANFATAILIEAGLSYLGFGIQPPQPSWGTMLNENYGYAISGKAFLAIIPALAIMLMVLAFNLVGNGFRDALDVKSKT